LTYGYNMLDSIATVVLIILVVGICLVALAAVGAVLWMRNREQTRDAVMQKAEALAQLDDALNDALKELNKVGNLVQKEINEKYQAMQFLYNLLEEKQKASHALPPEAVTELAMATAESVSASKAVTPDNDAMQAAFMKAMEAMVARLEAIPAVPEKKARATPKKIEEPAPKEIAPAPPVAAKPAPRKRTTNPKHKKVKDLHEGGMSLADIAKEMGIGQGEVKLILEMSGKK